MGGLTSHQGGRFQPTTQILVSLAGPVAGFALAAIVVALIKASGHEIQFCFRLALVIVWRFDGFANPATLRTLLRPVVREHLVGDFESAADPAAGWRSDYQRGAQYLPPARCTEISLWVSLIVATAMAATGLSTQPVGWFRILLFGSLAYGVFKCSLRTRAAGDG